MTLLRTLAVTALVAGATVLVAPAPAGAATCSGGDGVSVVVDYRELGGSTVTACAANGAGKSAAAIFAEVSVELSYAARQPGFVCRVNGVPTSDPCVNTSPADAFWGLWWSDGTRPWTYSSSGVGSLTVPAGGSVGWSWQQDRAAGQTVPPGVPAPTAPAPSESPTSSATASPTSSPSGTSSSSPSPSRSSEPTASPTRKADRGSEPETRSGREGGSAESGGTPDDPGSATTAEPSARPEPSSTSPAAKNKGRMGDKTSGSTEDSAAVETPTEDATPGSEAGTETPDGADADGTDEPTPIPAALTWGVVALLGVAVVVSAVVSRRRRGV